MNCDIELVATLLTQSFLEIIQSKTQNYNQETLNLE